MPTLAENRIRTGVPGFDEILRGGLIPRRTYLLRGGPGSGKTTLGLHFLINAPQSNSLFVSLGEAEQQLRDNAVGIGLSMEGVDVLDLSPGQEESGDTYTLLESWDVEGNSLHDSILDYVREHQPKRILIDSLSQMRYLSADTFLFRKQAMSLLRKLTAEGATVLFTSEQGPSDDDDETLAFLSDGVITLEQTDSGRQCQVTKLRGSSFAQGAHYFSLGDDGMTLYPRLVPSHHGRQVEHAPLGSGLPEFDALTHGGLERGTITLLSGPTGVGKTTLGAQLMSEAARRHERSVIYSFDEGASTFLARCRQVGLPVEEMMAAGHLNFEAVESLHYNPDEFAARVRIEIEECGATMVMIDSLSGYQQSVRGEDLQQRVHALCRYLVNMGVTVLLVNEVFSITGQQTRVTEYGLSYLADNIIMLRYIELDSELRKSIGVLKKRAGGFEKTLREFDITSEGLKVGQPFHGLRGILGGIPEVTTNSRDTT
ncbi:ATPase domain-containing protein [Chromohalobacter sp. HP20-39]|uniref:ATPase domain-containing protein n=1 Tax=Chromohalobacter sp. HP20-39 TaxID=3079306 RepID=UPI00294A9D42|nr:ATPase domain-containing protein [Chromohalobacter sp. HP20-39]MDV6319725.1 ATPase domain-containing protein [Chromohalobacter sp. HP20-39]